MSMPLMVVLGMTLVICLANGQATPPCAKHLSPCLDVMNSTKPPDTCCNPIKETQSTCFCQLVSTPGMLEGIGTTIAQALKLANLCGVNFTLTTCKASTSAPPPSLVQPPATLGGDEGGASRAAFTGLSFALFLCACVLFN
ncbi:hypothetical protein JHK85_030549 [Glycine max]|nr:hypothetical protein JHK85_030549 [Glycine max]